MARSFDHDEVLRDSGAYLASKLVPGLVGLLSVAVFVRLLGPEGYGKYALAFTIANLISVFCVGWLTQALLRYRSDLLDDEVTAVVIRSALVGSAAVGVGLLLVAFALGLRIGDTASLVDLLSLLALFGALSLFQVRITLLQADLRPGSVVLVSTIQVLLGVLIPVGLFLTASPTYSLALLGLTVSYLVAAARRPRWWVRAPLARRVIAAPEARAVAEKLWRYGWALSLWSAITTALQVSDRHFIQLYWGFEAAGSFAGVYDLVFRGYSLALFPVTLAVHPRMMHHWNGGRHQEAWSLWRWALAVQAALFVVVVVASVWLRDLAVWVVDPGNEEVGALIFPLVAGGFLWQFCLLAHKPLEMAGRTVFMLVAALLALAVNVAANVLLLPRIGVIATAYATMASGLLYLLLVLAVGAAVHRRPSDAGTA